MLATSRFKNYYLRRILSLFVLARASNIILQNILKLAICVSKLKGLILSRGWILNMMLLSYLRINRLMIC
jgi:hypothetical protein